MEHQKVPKNTVTRRDEHRCHFRNAKYLSVPQINSRWSPFPLHWLHIYPLFHSIQYKWLDFLEETTDIPWDTRLKSIWILNQYSNLRKAPCVPYRLKMGADSLYLTEEVSELSTSPSTGVFPQQYVCERDAVFSVSSGMDHERPWL